jgi:hypothetical protein
MRAHTASWTLSTQAPRGTRHKAACGAAGGRCAVQLQPEQISGTATACAVGVRDGRARCTDGCEAAASWMREVVREVLRGGEAGEGQVAGAAASRRRCRHSMAQACCSETRARRPCPVGPGTAPRRPARRLTRMPRRAGGWCGGLAGSRSRGGVRCSSRRAMLE